MAQGGVELIYRRTRDWSPSPPAERRILIIGKPGHGKSATGNSILGHEIFDVPAASQTNQCSYDTAVRFSKKLVVVDAPRSFDTRSVDDDISQEFMRVYSLLSPGFHAVLLALKPEKYMQEYQETIKNYIHVFGNEMLEYTVIIFTHWDQLQRHFKSLEDYFDQGTKELIELRSKCGGRAFVLDNNSKNVNQVEAVIEAMEENLIRLKGKCFSNLIFKAAEVFFYHYSILRERHKEKLELIKKIILAKLGNDIDGAITLAGSGFEDAYQARLTNESGDYERDQLRRQIANEDRKKQGVVNILFGAFKKEFSGMISKFDVDIVDDCIQMENPVDYGNGKKQIRRSFETQQVPERRILLKGKTGHGKSATGNTLLVPERRILLKGKTGHGKSATGNTLLVSERRILLIGKTGHGKSATGNTLLGKYFFKVSPFSCSLTSRCSYEKSFRFSRKLVIVDSPGFCDTRHTEDHIRNELIRACALLSPGFHAVFLVLKPEKFTEENQKAIEKYIHLFGNEMFDYTLLIMTHWDQLQGQVESLQDYFDHGSEELKELRSKCGNRIFSLSNTTKNEVEELVEAMEENLKRLNGKCLSNVVFKSTELAFYFYSGATKFQKELQEDDFNFDTEANMFSSCPEYEQTYQEIMCNESGSDERDMLRRQIAGEDEDSQGLFRRLVRFLRNLFSRLLGGF